MDKMSLSYCTRFTDSSNTPRSRLVVWRQSSNSPLARSSLTCSPLARAARLMVTFTQTVVGRYGVTGVTDAQLHKRPQTAYLRQKQKLRAQMIYVHP